MARNDEYNFTVIDENGNEVICDVISVLQDQKTNELFVVYTDYTTNDKGQFNTYLSKLEEKRGNYNLRPIESRERLSSLLKDSKSLYGKALEQLLSKES